jgi:hypothetical protein
VQEQSEEMDVKMMPSTPNAEKGNMEITAQIPPKKMCGRRSAGGKEGA